MTQPFIQAGPDDGAPFVVLDGRYSLRRLIAESAHSEIHAAEHLFTRRAVAVKIPRASSNVPNFERARREVEALARVRGEGVVELLDAGEVCGKPYMVLEMLEGRSLAGLLAARGRLSAEEVIEIGLEVTKALERCHARGVLHRDLKPGNLFVTTGHSRRITVLDFGIAKLAPELSRAGEKLTRDDAILGTPEYMAPESLLAARDVDHRADIYAIGVTLYECLAGAVPLEGSYGEVLLKISTTSPPSIKEARSDVPTPLAAVVDRCLKREPSDRYPAVAELRAALEGCLLVSSEQPTNAVLGGQPRRRPEPDTIADVPAVRNGRLPYPPRRHARAPYTTLARIALSDDESIDGRIEEVSEGGLQFVGDRSIPPGQGVRIRFALPSSGRVAEVRAAARWNRAVRGTNATGFEFLEVTAAACEELRKYVELMGRR